MRCPMQWEAVLLFTKLSGSSAQVHLTSKKKMTQIAGTLPAETAGKDLVKIRVEITSMSTVDAASGPYLYSNPTKGEAAINHIKITGEKETTADRLVSQQQKPLCLHPDLKVRLRGK